MVRVGSVAAAALLLLPPLCSAAGCGTLTTSQAHCSDPFCPLLLVSPGSKKGYCVRGKEPGEVCTTSAECQLAGCRVNGTGVRCPVANPEAPDPPNVTCLCAEPSGPHARTDGVLYGILAGVAYGSMFVPLRDHAGPATTSPPLQCLIFAGGWAMTATAAFVRPRGALLHLAPCLGGAALPLSHALSAVAVRMVGTQRAAAWWAVCAVASAWACGYWAPFDLPKDPNYKLICGVAGLVAAAAAILGAFQFLALDEGAGGGCGDEEEPLVTHVDARSVGTTPRLAAARTPRPITGSPSFPSRSTISSISDAGPDLPSPTAFEPAFRAAEAAVEEEEEDDDGLELSACQRIVFGMGLCCVSGVLSGVSLSPVAYTTWHWDDLTHSTEVAYSPHGVDYALSTASGALVAAILAAALTAVRGGSNTVPPGAVSSACLAGFVWGTGQLALTHAVGAAGLAVAVPVALCTSPVIATFWNGAVHREIGSASASQTLLGVFLSVVAVTYFALAG